MWTIIFTGSNGQQEHVGPFESEQEAQKESVRLLAHLDQRVNDKLTAEVRRVKYVPELLIDWA